MITSDRIALIGAHTIDLAFGLENGMPWPRTALKQDMARFKQRTSASPTGKKNLLMLGRKTYEAMDSKALPNRYMAVISREFGCVGLIGNDVFCAPSIESFLLSKAEKMEQLHHIFLIGGELIWKEGFKFASHAYITVINREVENQEGLKRLEVSLPDQALSNGFVRLSSETVIDDWDGPTEIEFLHYFRPLMWCD